MQKVRWLSLKEWAAKRKKTRKKKSGSAAKLGVYSSSCSSTLRSDYVKLAINFAGVAIGTGSETSIPQTTKQAL